MLGVCCTYSPRSKTRLTRHGEFSLKAFVKVLRILPCFSRGVMAGPKLSSLCVYFSNDMIEA